MLISIIIPVFNESKTILDVIKNVESITFPEDIKKEIIIVNDGSTDDTGEVLKQVEGHLVITQPNMGKGGAVRTGMYKANGDFVIIQDADLEQNPHDIPNLLAPVYQKQCDVVFGSRFLGMYRPKGIKMQFHYFLNKLYTHLTNLLSGLSTTDIWTGYKLYSRKALDTILPLYKSNGIEFELEIAVLLSKHNFIVNDVPVSYKPRWYGEGKKTNWKQALFSLYKLLQFSIKD